MTPRIGLIITLSAIELKTYGVEVPVSVATMKYGLTDAGGSVP